MPGACVLDTDDLYVIVVVAPLTELVAFTTTFPGVLVEVNDE